MTDSSRVKGTERATKTEDKMVQVFVRPFSSPDLDDGNFSPEAVLHFARNHEIDPQSFQERYLQTDFDIFAVAVGVPRVLDPIMPVIRQARANYVLGNFMSTIVLVGYAAEVLADLLGEIQPVRVIRSQNRKGNTEGQTPFVERLADSGILSACERQTFDRITKIRNDYLHHRPGASIAQDAEEIISLLPSILQRLFGHSFREGRLILQAELAAYLDREGHFSKE